ncbi:Methyl-CpG-binding domain protein 5 [Emydomyces testavorans]|uniref:Methyl-CpG-binding domain protein 5 n=1 Tax=Emydomyces testavorans TaxID=2070801 RepID=A0AAF0DEN8_9EURO|nr:Methyl-CpG-binding domain protein 5 [Emydomyces testavorans]
MSPKPKQSIRERHRHREQDSEDETRQNSTASRTKKKRYRHASSRRPSTTSSTKRKARQSDTTRRSSSSTSSLKNKKSPMPEAEDPYAESLLNSRVSRPYPAFSKEHSKEAVGSRETLGARINILTPEPTDITVEKTRDDRPSSRNKKAAEQSKRHSTATNPTRLPSPPLTNDETQPSRRSTPTVSKATEAKGGSTSRTSDEIKRPKSRPQSTRSSSSLKRVSSDHAQKHSEKVQRSGTPSSKFKILEAFQIPHKSPGKQKQHTKDDRTKSVNKSPRIVSPTTSVSDDETIVGPRTGSTAANHKTSSPLPSRNKKPGERCVTPAGGRLTPINVPVTNEPELARAASVNPPPPPPPPEIPLTIPKVDYLLQNGGLSYHVPRNLLGAGESANMPQHLFDPSTVGTKLFEPFSKLLDDYGTVMSKRGSLAVATGYRSVARRLLDRLEAVFARDISQEVCECLMCVEYEFSEETSGVSWGEVLELVSGRSELPSWPPFQIHTQPDAAEIGKSIHVPMQKLDSDVPSELRKHYILQSQKTKQAVDDWLSRQTQDSTSAPEIIDDETLAFAMLTYLDPEQRDLFSRLLELPTSPPSPKGESPKPRARPDYLISAGLAIQRLYRLAAEPRDPDTALYLVNNPDMHHVLATLAAISNDEWDILISGRFDGFLRSGADDDIPQSSATAPPWNGKRDSPRKNGVHNPRPASQPYGRRHGPASFGAPISVDEETEIAALAEIERDIYVGMEALEDAFEALHYKAEAIRSALRERGAGLAAANQARRGSLGPMGSVNGSPDLRFAGSGGSISEMYCETDDGIDDGLSSIAPSDSASNISSSRRRRPKRRTERRTPSVVGEEDEEDRYMHTPKRTGTASSGRKR